MNILVAEDIRAIREAVKFHLKTNGFNVFGAVNGIEALEILEREHIDLIVTDIDMPEMGGLELISEVRVMENAGHVPILVFSARKGDMVCDAAMALGANKCMEKTSRMSLLVHEVTRLLKDERSTGPRSFTAASGKETGGKENELHA